MATDDLSTPTKTPSSPHSSSASSSPIPQSLLSPTSSTPPSSSSTSSVLTTSAAISVAPVLGVARDCASPHKLSPVPHLHTPQQQLPHQPPAAHQKPPQTPKKSSFSISSILGEDENSNQHKRNDRPRGDENDDKEGCDKSKRSDDDEDDDCRQEAVVTSISDLYHRFQVYSDQARLGQGLASRAANFGLWYPWYPGIIASQHGDGEFSLAFI
ncbi:hypothetical protein PoB_001067700 [Plakobranchus ocellatus]|uniref:Uncharacterized protein n=1 Tax=Plakobranchus ocellatus TaxID=259542 RepID=A0AAV3YPW4_9GAST|nr:hypothetical protein PoB_001067700 [Plakobranchus ocellatus]